ncbi:LysR family transcriptional regulator [Segniliparus rotundus]|uniref:LysR family transcriptional regulator n=1 Tax=Segniliparus rotundus TaxID=286802 RepID=UPI0002EA7331|nr:LysR family transcriptional regulator [Segniliparus rotundus]
MQIRQLEYFVALAAERHFTKASEVCHVSQPAFSEALGKLERELRVPLVRRGHAFEGLTPEGERLLVWARRLLADHEAMRAEADALRVGVSGRARIGAVPGAAAVAAKLIAPFCARHPLATVQLATHLSFSEILRQVRDFELDAGITFLDEGTEGLPSLLLYEERYMLLASKRLLAERDGPVPWTQASALPMAALAAGMRGRALVDDACAQAGVQVDVQVQTDSIESLCALAGTGRWATVAPSSWVQAWEFSGDIAAVPIIEPEVVTRMGLVFTASTPTPALTTALFDVARRLKLG